MNWNGKKKAITFSFDDGVTQDILYTKPKVNTKITADNNINKKDCLFWFN